MFKLLALFCIISAVKSDTSKEWFDGRWTAVMEFPGETWFPICIKFELEATPDRYCKCGKKTIPVIGAKILPDNSTDLFPAIIVETSAEVKDALAMNCECDINIEKKIAVYRKVNENYFIIYTRHHKPNEDYKAFLLLKKVPKLSELREIVKNIDDLSQKQPAYLCETNFFINEFDDLD